MGLIGRGKIYIVTLLTLVSASGNARLEANEEQALSKLLDSLSDSYAFTVDTVSPSTETPMFRLGMELFFSKSLSGNQDVACASCHHPYLAGGDSLSLPVGESPYNDNWVGPGRWHDWQRSADPKADGTPNVARHSQTTFNASLYSRSMFYDGRIFVLDPTLRSHGEDQRHRTPDSNLWQGDGSAGRDLLATQVRFPVISTDEMRGHTIAADSTNEGVRHALIERLKQSENVQQWLQLFRQAFASPTGSSNSLITFANIETAISYYQSTQILLDAPWFDYVNGKTNALTASQKRGAKLFLTSPDKGGAGCINCHTPPIFTDEKFHNIAAVQIGRGKQPNGEDFGRRGVTQQDKDRYGFRTPSLLNVTATAPYTHAGAFTDLDAIIAHHLAPDESVSQFDFSFANNPQLKHVAGLLSDSKQHTQDALAQLNREQAAGSSLLPAGLTLAVTQIDDLKAFLASLTDPCITDRACMAKWVPDSNAPAPDEHRLVAEFRGHMPPPQPVAIHLEATHTSLPHQTPGPALPAALLSDDAFGCSRSAPTHQSLAKHHSPHQSAKRFDEVAVSAGLAHKHHINWENYTLSSAQRLIFSGGLAAGDIDGDCWPDLFFATGDAAADVLYKNERNGTFSDVSKVWGLTSVELSNGAAMVDIDGDGDLDLFTSNLLQPELPSITGQKMQLPDSQLPTLYLNDAQQKLHVAADIGLQIQLTSWSFAFADVNKDGTVDMLTNHWRGPGLGGEQPTHLWSNISSSEGIWFEGLDTEAGLTDLVGNADFTFTANFTDINNDGWLDLLFAADFETSQVYKNLRDGTFARETHAHEISDQNGMGAAVADYDNDGYLDWFVSSIWDPNGKPEGSWGVSGNRLYHNHQGRLEDATTQAGVAEGLWAWGACFADFNNDGWLDLFHVNGFDLPPQLSRHLGNPLAYRRLKQAMAEFENTPSRLFISNQDGTFTERSRQWGISDTFSGRGVVCMDYDRDGDVDIVVSNHEQRPVLYANRHNDDASNNYLSITLRDSTQNTRALGAKVHVTTGNTTQLQEVRAGGGFLSGAPSTLHFGLGDASQADTITIEWPDKTGSVSTFHNIPANQFLYIQADRGSTEQRSPSPPTLSQ